jgi:hypothetical protein
MRHFSKLCGLTTRTLPLAGLLFTIQPANAEFEIKEATIEKGEVELEYRGAVHWGLPGSEDASAGALDEEEEAPLRQSHDFEGAWGIAERWLLSTTIVTDQPLGEAYEVSAVALEVQYELIEREGDGLGLGFTGGLASPLAVARPTKSNSVRLWNSAGDLSCSLSTRSLLIRLVSMPKPTVLASNMAGAHNITSPGNGPSVPRCSGRSTICRMPGPLVTKNIALGPHCSTAPPRKAKGLRTVMGKITARKANTEWSYP